MKSSIRKWARVYFSSRSASPVSDAYSGMRNTIKSPSENWQKQKCRQRLKVDMFAFVSLMHYMKHWICHVWEICRGLWRFHQSPWGITLRNTQQNRWGECANALRNHRLFCQQRCHMNALLGLFSEQLTWCMIMSLTREQIFFNIVARRIDTSYLWWVNSRRTAVTSVNGSKKMKSLGKLSHAQCDTAIFICTSRYLTFKLENIFIFVNKIQYLNSFSYTAMRWNEKQIVFPMSFKASKLKILESTMKRDFCPLW